MTPRFTTSLSNRARKVIAGSCVFLVGALTLPSSAVMAEESTPPATPTRAGVADLPPSEGFVLAGIVSSTQVAVARTAKMTIEIDENNPIFGVLRYGRWNAPIEDPVGYDGPASFVPWPFDDIPCATVPVEDYPLGQYVPSDVTFFTVTPEGAVDEVGQLPATRVNLLAFGSIPASVTVNLSMTRNGGQITPWLNQLWQPNPVIPGCGVAGAAEFYRSVVEGQADMRLSDLVIDGVPVDLGPSCRTQTPVNVSLWGEDGYFALEGGLLGQYDGLATGTRIPLVSPQYFEQEGRMIPDSTGLDIPPFVGCGTGGEDLSDVVTAMASGPNNPVRIAQGNPTKVPYDPDNILACDITGACPLPAPAAPAAPPLPDGETR